MGKNAIDQMRDLYGENQGRQRRYTEQAQSLGDLLSTPTPGLRKNNGVSDILGWTAAGAGTGAVTAGTAGAMLTAPLGGVGGVPAAIGGSIVGGIGGLATGSYRAVVGHDYENVRSKRLRDNMSVTNAPLFGRFVMPWSDGQGWAKESIIAEMQARSPQMDFSTKTDTGRANLRMATLAGADLNEAREGGASVHDSALRKQIIEQRFKPALQSASEQAKQAKEESTQVRLAMIQAQMGRDERAENRAADMAKLARSEALQREEIALRRESLAMERERLSRGPEESRIAGIYNMAASLAAAAARGI